MRRQPRWRQRPGGGGGARGPGGAQALAGRGIVIPDHTWFVPAEHDTTTDEVRLLVDDVPVPHAAMVAELERDLAEAGRRLAAPARGVGRRRWTSAPCVGCAVAADWAQVRPEWASPATPPSSSAPRRHDRC
ncbi:MAG: putative inorganic carbon transporter subunit DabA [Acidimicrobiales bacterium]